jgi:diaminopimelate epimerase
LIERAFTKLHGLGNDFVLFDAREAPLALSEAQVRRLGNRHTGIGFDQLIVLEPSAVADVKVRFWNSDGGEVAVCGNGSRAVAAWLGGKAVLETGGGLIATDASGADAIIDMGLPRFDWDAVPLAFAMDTLHLPLGWEGLDAGSAVSVGNPHVVFFVADAAAIDLARLGPVIEHDPVFPERVNVGVAQMQGRDVMRLNVWERGAGLTLACGTGAVAAVAAAQRRGLADAAVAVDLPGGRLHVQRDADGHLHLSGPAQLAFTGLVDLERYA